MNSQANRKKSEQEKTRTAVLRMELDYELAMLYEAIQENNEKQKHKSMERLEKIRSELLTLKAL
ncbi:MAG: hypothetical protein LOD92_04165 [Bacillales bacterium]